MKRNIIFCLIVFCSITSYSQKQKGTKGVYLNNDGQEVEAYFNFQHSYRDNNNNQGIKPATLYVYEGKKLVEKLTAEDISAVILDSDTLESITIETKVLGKERTAKEFAKKYSGGALNLYYIKLTTTHSHGGMAGAVPTTSGSMACVRKEGMDTFISFQFPKKGKKKFVELIADHEELAKKVDKMGTFEFLKNHQEVIEEYNKWAAESD